MQEYVKLIDDIQAMLSSGMDPLEKELHELAEQYNEVVESVNKRLRFCDDLIRKGHRGEAIQHCEDEPNLLDLVATLDFPESASWTEFVKEYGLRSPPELLIDAAADLNEAYTAEQPLEQLMRKHRLHALARSPLTARIEVMRKVAEIDEANPIWKEDISTFEQVRHVQMAREMEGAVKADDIDSLSRLEGETRSVDWIERPPQDLVAKIVSSHTQLRQRQAREDLEQVEVALTSAFSSFDMEDGLRARERWYALSAIAIESDDDPICERVAPALDWLADQERIAEEEAEHTNSLGELELALDDGADRATLERLYHAASRFQGGVPDALRQRLSSRIQMIELQRSRRSRNILVVLLATIGTAAALIAITTRYHLRNSAIQDHATLIEKMIHSGIEIGDFGEAISHVEGLKGDQSWVHQDPRIRALSLQLSDAILAEEQRAEHLRAQCAEVEKLISTDPTIDILNEAENALDRIVGKNPSEQLQLEKLRGGLSATRDQLLRLANEAWAKTFADFRELVEDVDARDTVSIEQLKRRGIQLRNEHLHVAMAHEQIESQLALLERKLRQEVQRRAAAQALARVTAAVGNIARYDAALKQYADQFEGQARSISFQKVIRDDLAICRANQAWHDFDETWSAQDLTRLSSGEAEALLKQCQRMISDHGTLPISSGLQHYVKALKAIASRGDAEGGKSTSLIELLNQDQIADLYMLATTDGRRFYSQVEPKSSGERWRISYLEGNDVTKTRSIPIEKSLVTNTSDWTAPQSRFRENVLVKLRKLESDSDTIWETTYYLIVRDLLNEQRMDPVLKMLLMRKILDVACAGSQPLTTALEGYRTKLSGDVDLSANWISPTDKDAENARLAAMALLKGLPPLSDLLPGLRQELKRMRRPTLGDRYEWVGWLHKVDATGQWTCELQRSRVPSGATDLYVAVAGPDRKTIFQSIGRVSGEKTELSSSNDARFVEGRPVYCFSLP